MYKGLKVCALIAAAGKSRRMGGKINKQLILLDGIPVLARTLKVFDEADIIDNIVVVSAVSDIEYYTENIINKYGTKKVINVIAGGAKRQQSIMNGLCALSGACDIVAVHDGARPFVTASIINRSVEEAYLYGAAACGVNVKDTIKVIDSDSFIKETPDRNTIYAVQTPQTFWYDLLYEAHKKAIEEGFQGTDDTVLVERQGVKVKLFLGSYENIKITTPEDIFVAEAILKHKHL